MTGHREHPFDKPLAAMVKAMEDADAELGHMSAGIRDFDSKELTPAEDELVFHNPNLRYLGQVEPTTGLPFTNAQAAQKLLQDIGPEQYVAYVEDFVRRLDRRATSVPAGVGSTEAPINADPEVEQGPPTASRNDSRSWVQGGVPKAEADDLRAGGGARPANTPGTIGSGTIGGGLIGDSNATT